jgi:hypothetical protein
MSMAGRENPTLSRHARAELGVGFLSPGLLSNEVSSDLWSALQIYS